MKKMVAVSAVLIGLVLVGSGAYLEIVLAPSLHHSDVTISGSVRAIGSATGVNFTSSSGVVYSAPATIGGCDDYGFFGDCLSDTYVYSIQLPNNAQYSVTVAQSPGSPCNAGVIQVSGNNDAADLTC